MTKASTCSLSATGERKMGNEREEREGGGQAGALRGTDSEMRGERERKRRPAVSRGGPC